METMSLHGGLFFSQYAADRALAEIKKRWEPTAPPMRVVALASTNSVFGWVIQEETPQEKTPREQRLEDALKVMLLDPKIRPFLEKNDPKSVQQAIKALGEDPLTDALKAIGQVLGEIS